MSWTILIGILLVLGFLSAVATLRRAELGAMERSVADRDRAASHGDREALLQHPVVDLTRCMGCATCVAVCPEDGVLEIVHGQATIVNGARCMGISACERECPVGAITVTLANAETRRDVPAVEETLEAVGTPGLFLAGEVTAQALIRTAVVHGARVAREAAARVRESGRAADGTLDLAIVGAGPAGLACALEAKRIGLSYTVLDRAEGWGGTVATYPRNKLVLTEPVDLPLHGRIRRTELSKEELMELWTGVAEQHALPLLGGRTLEAVEREPGGDFALRFGDERVVARNVCLAIGRRGTPRRLGVPGEELPKVVHSLVDATSFRERRILVVGGGDSAVEAALALASTGDNTVTLSYRRGAFVRVRSRNAEKLEEAAAEGRIELLLESEVVAIHEGSVELALRAGGFEQHGSIANDDVFVMIGGVPPVATLEAAGVSFDPDLRPPLRAAEEPREGSSDLVRALRFAAAGTACVLGFVLAHSDYYFASQAERAVHAKHEVLRPGAGLGLTFGIVALALVAVNLAYLLRRSPRFRLKFGSLRDWMTVHVATGVVAVVIAFLHAALEPRSTAGGKAAWMLAALMVTGAIGRWFYAWVPRAANGRELELDEIRAEAGSIPNSWGTSRRGFGERVRIEVNALIAKRQWHASFFGRALALLGTDHAKRRALARLEAEGAAQGVPREQIDRTLDLVRRAHARALAAAHLEDLRAVASTWRWLHRWGAVLMLALVLVHVVHALIFGNFFGGGGA